MPPFDAFAHYVAYGATDQETIRELTDSYDGVLVPGTIAAFQRQGTGGFVLSLSATDQAPPYIIDPRFPLFQQALPGAKKSHEALATLLGDPGLIRATAPSPGLFDDRRLESIARAWVEFNTDYDSTSTEKFDKYAARLGEPIPRPTDAKVPEFVLAPYFAVDSPDDPWWGLSQRLFDYAVDAAGGAGVVRVVAVKSVDALDALLNEVPDKQVAVWASGLNEYEASEAKLVAYRDALRGATSRGQSTFALYGGFFSVLLRRVGLCGSAHGIGFSEHRDWEELPESGAPPARYYMRRLHRYVQPALAQELYLLDPMLSACDCAICQNRPPAELDYHGLMKHSVRARQREIDDYEDVALETAADVLRDEHAAFTTQVADSSLLPAVKKRTMGAASHLPRWANALTKK